MNENRRQILEMLAAGKITAEEAERLLAALDPTMPAHGSSHRRRFERQTPPRRSRKTRAKYLRVLVEADESMTGMKGPTTVNVRVPMQLLRAGVRLAGLIPHRRTISSTRPSASMACPHPVADQAGEPRRADRPP